MIADCGEKIYIKALKRAIQKAKERFKFEQIAISIGFDTYQGDLASLGLRKESYKKIGKIIKDLSKETNARVFAVFDGGFSTNLCDLIHEFILGLKD